MRKGQLRSVPPVWPIFWLNPLWGRQPISTTSTRFARARGAGICSIQAESAEEIVRIAARARAAKRRARVAIRINPGVEVDTHAHIATGHDAAKFGVPTAELPQVFERIDAEGDALVAVGVSTHIGSMQASPEAYRASARRVADLVRARAERASERAAWSTPISAVASLSITAAARRRHPRIS